MRDLAKRNVEAIMMALGEAGASEIVQDRSTKHGRVTFSLNGYRASVPYPLGKQCPQAFRNQFSMTRRLCRQMLQGDYDGNNRQHRDYGAGDRASA